MKLLLKSIINRIDNSLSDYYLKNFTEKDSFITFLFHGLFKSDEEINTNMADPQQGITLSHFRQFIEHFLENGYKFVSPTNVLYGLKPNNKYGLITFDDGYYNNVNALPILKEFKIPAVFFISVNHIKENKCFWWDIIYREGLRQGLSKKKIYIEQMSLKHKTNDEIEKYILKKYGESVFSPLSDIDRPFTVEELKRFSVEDSVFIGNHTSNHAILTNYDLNKVQNEISNAQDELFNITGRKPIAISYPNGNYSNEIIRISRELGLRIGITVEARKNYFPIDNMMKLGRYALDGKYNIENQCRIFRSDLKLKDHLLKTKKRCQIKHIKPN